MTPESIKLVQNSFAKVVPIADVAADIFYDRLFEIAPETRSMFKEDMTAQKKALMGMLATAVNGLTNLDKIVPAVRQLGERHAGYGVKDEHYDSVAAALLYTLEKGLGEDWTDDLKLAWTETYVTLATVMKEAAATTSSSVTTITPPPAKKKGFFSRVFG